MMTNRPDHVNHPEAVQLPTTLHVDTVSIVSVISRSNHSNDDAKNDAEMTNNNNTKTITIHFKYGNLVTKTKSSLSHSMEIRFV